MYQNKLSALLWRTAEDGPKLPTHAKRFSKVSLPPSLRIVIYCFMIPYTLHSSERCTAGEYCLNSHDVIPYPFCHAFNNTGRCTKPDCRFNHQLFEHQPPSAVAAAHVECLRRRTATSQMLNDNNKRPAYGKKLSLIRCLLLTWLCFDFRPLPSATRGKGNGAAPTQSSTQVSPCQLCACIYCTSESLWTCTSYRNTKQQQPLQQLRATTPPGATSCAVLWYAQRSTSTIFWWKHDKQQGFHWTGTDWTRRRERKDELAQLLNLSHCGAQHEWWTKQHQRARRWRQRLWRR